MYKEAKVEFRKELTNDSWVISGVEHKFRQLKNLIERIETEWKNIKNTFCRYTEHQRGEK